MAKVFTIDYTIKSKKTSFKASILSNTREKAIDYIYGRVGVIRVNTVTQHGKIDAVDDEVVDEIIKNSSLYKSNNQKIKKKNKIIENMQDDIEHLKEQLDKREQNTPSKGIAAAMKLNKKKVYACPYCDFESEKRNGIKMHITKMHKKE